MFPMKISMLERSCLQDANFLLHLEVKKKKKLIVTHLQKPLKIGGRVHNRRFSDMSPSAVLVDKELNFYKRKQA